MSDIKNSEPSDSSKRDFVVVAGVSVAAVGAACVAWPMIDTMNPASDVLAMSSIEVSLDNIPEGHTITAKWRGKPVFIKHRTPKEIEEANKVDVSTLRDPQSDSERVKKGKEQWLVVVGVCTHLGCIPLDHQGEYDGWFCPCHGSQYDTSGRIRKGPAPLNLEVPKYDFIADTKIKIG